jgi:GntR family transcriptional repressor for pyruvate dehydrogenase complex
VGEDLTARIRTGVYRTGEKMPTEPELMVEQGVSRTVVREAISQLQAAGLVETRHGIGTFVLTPRTPTPPTLDLATAVTLRDVMAMLELRISLEAEAAGLAAQRRTKEHLALMRQAVRAFEQGVASGGDSVDPDFQFHLQIARATGNRYFEDVFRHLGTNTIPRTRLNTSQLSPEVGPTYLYRVNREHESILDAIARKDSEAARAGMRVHLTSSRERLRRASRGEAKPGGNRSHPGSPMRSIPWARGIDRA